jgi:mRNA-degrading endonuclease toxin of MazEF toxin-antitoxin module
VGRSGDAGGGRPLDERLTPRRGDIYGVVLPTRDGEARKLAVVVSADAINQAGMNVVIARLTRQDRYRSVPSVVVVEAEEQTGLSATSFVLCHDLHTLPQSILDPRPVGTLPLGKIIEVEDKLRYALDLRS